ncbi:hypothetical protein Spb1_17440 [Planctopirus ephydatiae]|uniref:Uncharacterized protein n=1 Tax=Planctopirus ephydatiae TaxID=2528019 RepID=A0A518GMN6_9PLAN|nr:hypothetical protein Spb1_17440 [Planctopirus ephydatiae]
MLRATHLPIPQWNITRPIKRAGSVSDGQSAFIYIGHVPACQGSFDAGYITLLRHAPTSTLRHNLMREGDHWVSKRFGSITAGLQEEQYQRLNHSPLVQERTVGSPWGFCSSADVPDVWCREAMDLRFDLIFCRVGERHGVVG